MPQNKKQNNIEVGAPVRNRDRKVKGRLIVGKRGCIVAQGDNGPKYWDIQWEGEACVDHNRFYATFRYDESAEAGGDGSQVSPSREAGVVGSADERREQSSEDEDVNPQNTVEGNDDGDDSTDGESDEDEFRTGETRAQQEVRWAKRYADDRAEMQKHVGKRFRAANGQEWTVVADIGQEQDPYAGETRGDPTGNRRQAAERRRRRVLHDRTHTSRAVTQSNTRERHVYERLSPVPLAEQVKNMNEYITKLNSEKHTRNDPTTEEEWRKFQGLCIVISLGMYKGVNGFRRTNPEHEQCCFPAPDYGGVYGMTERRFTFLKKHAWRCYGGVDDRKDPWWRIRPAIDGFNASRKREIATSKHLVLDETMCGWRPRADKFGGLPFIMYVPRKPEPHGVEWKTVCDGHSKVMLHMELQEGAERMKALPLTSLAQGRTSTACTLRLASAASGAEMIIDLDLD